MKGTVSANAPLLRPRRPDWPWPAPGPPCADAPAPPGGWRPSRHSSAYPQERWASAPCSRPTNQLKDSLPPPAAAAVGAPLPAEAVGTLQSKSPAAREVGQMHHGQPANLSRSRDLRDCRTGPERQAGQSSRSCLTRAPTRLPDGDVTRLPDGGGVEGQDLWRRRLALQRRQDLRLCSRQPSRSRNECHRGSRMSSKAPLPAVAAAAMVASASFNASAPPVNW